jgi:hypothetical protein
MTKNKCMVAIATSCVFFYNLQRKKLHNVNTNCTIHMYKILMKGPFYTLKICTRGSRFGAWSESLFGLVPCCKPTASSCTCCHPLSPTHLLKPTPWSHPTEVTHTFHRRVKTTPAGGYRWHRYIGTVLDKIHTECHYLSCPSVPPYLYYFEDAIPPYLNLCAMFAWHS